MHKITSLILIILLAGTGSTAYAASSHEGHTGHMAEGGHDMHGEHRLDGHMRNAGLTESGNAAFGTLQEVLQKLLADPETDWSKVNMEALRRHLVDMRNFTENVDVIRQTAITRGVEVILKPFNERVADSLDRVFAAHPAQLKRETGWDMRTEKQNTNGQVQYKITITAGNESDAVRIRGLGYIGIMAWGNHHQPHHWMMATGNNPH